MDNARAALSDIHDVVDYVIGKFADEGGVHLLKLQKLLYYVQAWHLATEGDKLFRGKFQAWVHGPVSRTVYDRFKDTHALYSSVSERDIRAGFQASAISRAHRRHIDEILEAYGGYSGTQLEDMTHEEEPWIAARGKLRPSERCESELDEKLMADYYRRQLN